MATGAAIAIGAGAALSAGLGLWGSKKQADAAEEAARLQREAGQEASGIIQQSYMGARDELTSGARDQLEALQRAGLMTGYSADEVRNLAQSLDERYARQRLAGDEALSRLQATLLGGDMSGFESSPGYQFRMEQGLQAIDRAAAARGNMGGGAHLRALNEYGQGVASQEYGSYINRLMGLQGIGAQATSESARTAMGMAGLRSSLLGQQAGYTAQGGAVQGALGGSLAGLRTSTAANRANALIGAQSQAIQYDLAGAQASAQGLANVGNSIQQATMLYALMGGGGGGGGAQIQPGMGNTASLGRGREIMTQYPPIQPI